MITAIAQTLTLFCTVIVVVAAATWAATLNRHTPRQVAHRIAITFAVFAVAGGYVWLALGPEIDGRLATSFAPLLGDPKPIDV